MILTGAAVEGAGLRSWTLLLGFAAGAACPLALALSAGERVFRLMKRSLRCEEWLRRALGVAVLAGVAVTAFGWDRSLFSRLSLGSPSMRLESSLARRFESSKVAGAAVNQAATLADDGPMPDLSGATHWINSPPITRLGLAGKVVVIDFWTYSCINCLRSLPYLRSWFAKYADSGLVVIGIHSPEFAFERDETNVEQAVRDLQVSYPVANDSARTIWKAFGNHYWPAHYFIDIRGRVRYHHFGEGDYEEAEQVIQRLLAERNGRMQRADTVLDARGVEAAASSGNVQSHETYVGYEGQDNLASPEDVHQDVPSQYSAPATLNLNEWAFAGLWNIGAEQAAIARAPASIVFRFHARDLHLVMGTAGAGKTVPFRVKLDGQPVGMDKGVDVDESGNGAVSAHRLYQLIRQKGPVRDRTFEIEFLQPGVQVFAFTFG